MKPIAVFQHAPTEGPGYLAHFLDRCGLPWQVIRIDQGEHIPLNADLFSGLVFMGGPMSANDDLSWIAESVALIREAYAKDIPLLGHCLGGQLIAKAFGGIVSKNSVKEIGWGEVAVSNNSVAREWFGGVQSFEAFHWHSETFSLPRGAVHLLSGLHCTNQAYAMGKHIGLQCHIEMTEQMIRDWCDIGADEIKSCVSPAVQDVETIQSEMLDKLPQLHRIADQIYRHWLHGIRLPS